MKADKNSAITAFNEVVEPLIPPKERTATFNVKEKIFDENFLLKQTSNMRNQQACCTRRKIIICVCAISSIGFVLCLYTWRTMPEFTQYNLVREYSESDAELQWNDNMSRTILLWNSFFGNKRWGLPDDTLGTSFFRDDLKCPVYHCELTNNHDFLPALDLYDAILFHTAEPFPLLSPIPRKRNARQLYVFALMEPPGETKHILNDEGGFYNLTMTYRLDSDLPWPYKNVYELESGRIVAPTQYPLWKSPATQWNDTVVWKLLNSKTKNAAWFVSHCNTLSKREKLVEELQKYIDVDIYGKCGTLSCKYTSKECDDLLDQQYKFYLSFENSLCIDYVTEKLYNALQRQIIPVVFGGANYTRFLPPYSYINAEDFETPKALASYLTFLSTHPEEYVRYFWWRTEYGLKYHSPFCDLCEKLHNKNYQHKMQTYQDIEKWWLRGSCRFKTKIKF